MTKDLVVPLAQTVCVMHVLQVNLRHGVQGPATRTGTETDTCTACAGTMILEFAALSRFTGDPVFEVRIGH